MLVCEREDKKEGEREREIEIAAIIKGTQEQMIINREVSVERVRVSMLVCLCARERGKERERENDRERERERARERDIEVAAIIKGTQELMTIN